MELKIVAIATLETMARYGLLRSLIPVVRLYSERNNSQECRALYYQTVNNLQRSLLFWRYAPSKYTGGLLLNLIGYQFLRYMYFNLRFMFRPRVDSGALPERLFREIHDSGCVSWPNALSAEELTTVLSFFTENRSHAMQHFDDFSELVIANSKGPVRTTEDYRRIYELIRNATRWDEIGSALSRRKMRISPYIAILHYKSRMACPIQLDGQDTPHTDVFYPSFKAFYYLNDVDKGNGPLTYFRNSHAFGLSRAIQECRDSISYFSGARKEMAPISSQQFADSHNFVGEPLTGTRGSGILFNVQGIHCRGEFSKDKDRERIVLLIDFRQVEAPAQRLAA